MKNSRKNEPRAARSAARGSFFRVKWRKRMESGLDSPLSIRFRRFLKNMNIGATRRSFLRILISKISVQIAWKIRAFIQE